MPVEVAYIVGYYPAVSHTFISREVDGLRARGHRVETLSLHRAPAADLLTDADLRAAAETFVVQPPKSARLLTAHVRALARRPSRYLATLALALRMSPGGLRDGVWHGFYFAEAVLVADELRRRGLRHLHAHFANAASAVALLAAHLDEPDGLTWSFTMHGPTEFDDVTRYALREKVRRAAFVACISDYCRSQLMKLVDEPDWHRLSIVHCGVDPDHFTPADRAASSRSPGRTEVLCVGRLVPDKGQSVLLEAIAALRAEGLDLRATLVGAGPDRDRLEERSRSLGLAEAVRFTGAVGQDRIRRLYAEADVFCLPSFAEGVPVVLMEAMATGLPVVTSRIMGIPELVRDEQAGLLVRPGRADELAGALRRLAVDPDLRTRLGTSGRRVVADEYDIADAVLDLEALLAGVGRR